MVKSMYSVCIVCVCVHVHVHVKVDVCGLCKLMNNTKKAENSNTQLKQMHTYLCTYIHTHIPECTQADMYVHIHYEEMLWEQVFGRQTDAIESTPKLVQ